MTGAAQAMLCSTALSSGGSGSVSLTTRTVSNTGPGTGTISVGYKLRSNGNAYKVTSADALLEAWLDSGSASQFEVRASLISGPSPTGAAVGTWLALSADRVWTISAGAGATSTTRLTVAIRDVATQTIQDSATITLVADNSGGGGGGGGGGAGGTVSISDQSIVVEGNSSGTISATYELDSDGNVRDQGGNILEAWLDSGVAGDFQARATVTAGALTSGTTGTWLALSSNRLWVLSAAMFQHKVCTLLIEIRDVASLTVLDSATINLTATN